MLLRLRLLLQLLIQIYLKDNDSKKGFRHHESSIYSCHTKQQLSAARKVQVYPKIITDHEKWLKVTTEKGYTMDGMGYFKQGPTMRGGGTYPKRSSEGAKF